MSKLEESLQTELAIQKERAHALSAKVAELEKNAEFFNEEADDYCKQCVELEQKIRHLKLSEAGKRGVLIKKNTQLQGEIKEKERVIKELKHWCHTVERRYLLESVKCRNLMFRNLWQRIINKPVTTPECDEPEA